MEILTEEILGINVHRDKDDPAEASPTVVLRALAGCEQPENASHPTCLGKPSRYHASLGVSITDIQAWENTMQQMRLRSVINTRSLGYTMVDILYVNDDALERARNEENLKLEYYGSYEAPNAAWRQFAKISEFDTSMLLPCETALSWDLPNYVRVTGDAEGVIEVDGRLRWNCADRWWLAPACRGNSSTCIPLFVPSWGFPRIAYPTEIMLKAAVWQLTFAVGILDGIQPGDSFHDTIAARDDILFWYWAPTLPPAGFARRKHEIMFPPYNGKEWADGNTATAAPGWPASVAYRTDLAQLAPEAFYMLSRMSWTREDVEAVLILQAASNLTDKFTWAGLRDGACKWLHANERVWRRWIPVKSSCLPGQGMFSEETQEFVGVRAASTVCQPCPPGLFSASASDETGETAICSPCTPGTISPNVGALACQGCFEGTFANASGMSVCEKCPQGGWKLWKGQATAVGDIMGNPSHGREYQDMPAASACKACSEKKITLFLGATSAEDCECMPGTYWYNGSCISCQEGLFCKGGLAPVEQKAGFWVEVENVGSDEMDEMPRYSVFLCRDTLQCPQGGPGQCATGRTGRSCGACMLGTSARSNGTCQLCDGIQLLPIIFWLAAVALLVLVLTFGCMLGKKMTLNAAMITVVFGQMVVCMQSLAAIYKLDVAWLEPAKSFLRLMTVLSLDLDVSCFLPPAHTTIFALRLATYPIAAAVVLYVWWLLKLFRTAPKFHVLINLHGILTLSLFTAMSDTVLSPFQCRGNPNGLPTLQAHSDVICWRGEHETLATMGVLGILAYPVAIFTWFVYLTWMYPKWVTSGTGLDLLERYRFLFGRFRSDRYYGGVLFTLLNFAIAAIPVLLVFQPILQIGTVSLVLCTRLVLQAVLWPWKQQLPNFTEMVLSTGLLGGLVLAAPLLNMTGPGSEALLSGILTGLFASPLAGTLFVALCAFSYRWRRHRRYFIFLCHHKQKAGALCRYMKLVIAKHVRTEVFLDSDQLEDLSLLFDMVATDTGCLIAVLTGQTLQRAWCAGEITSAYKQKVPILPVYCDGFQFPGVGSSALESLWGQADKRILLSCGISLADVQAAYEHVQSLERIAFSRSDVPAEQEQQVIQVLAMAHQMTGIKWTTNLTIDPQGDIASTSTLIFTTARQPEAVSTSLMLQQLMQVEKLRAFYVGRPEDISSALGARSVVILLSEDALTDPCFARLVLATKKAQLANVMVTDSTFEFPSAELYKKIQQQDERIGRKLVRAYKSMLTSVAMPLTPSANEEIVRKQAWQIAERCRLHQKRMDRSSSSLSCWSRSDSSGSTPVEDNLSSDGSGDRPPHSPPELKNDVCDSDDDFVQKYF
ncbi:CRMB1 [Symbiodinium sp. KB8]|nr:CRMB1 [Symbiodinium sp. KB8]